MSEELRWNLSVQIVSGPTIAASGTLRTDSYNKTQVVIPAHSGGVDGTLTVTVNSAGAELLIVKAGQYVDATDAAKFLKYDINDAGSPKNLTAPLMLLGADTIKLLADPVTKITFTNPIAVAITADIIVGGDVTPP